MIAKKHNKWIVLNSEGTRVLGTYPGTPYGRTKALAQLAAIEISKQRKGLANATPSTRRHVARLGGKARARQR